MCLAVPGRVIEVSGDSAVVDMGGRRSTVGLGLLSAGDRPCVGDYVVSHLGMALSRMEEAEALELLEMLEAFASGEEEVAAI